jgi:hypothetical protein
MTSAAVRRKRKVAAMLQALSMQPDGSPQPLTLRELLLYGTPRVKLEAKLRRVRRHMLAVDAMMANIGDDHAIEKEVRCVALLIACTDLFDDTLLCSVSLAQRNAMSRCRFVSDVYLWLLFLCHHPL